MSKNTIMFLLALLCFGVAAHLAVNYIKGWGWLVFGGILCAGDIKHHKT